MRKILGVSSGGSRLAQRIVVLSTALWLPAVLAGPALPQTLPSVQMTVPASSAAIPFGAWFSTASPLPANAPLNAAFTPADSVGFSNTPNADFYRWSYRMFLWLTSPTPAAYGGTGRVFSSPEFYMVTPEDASGNRTLVRNPAALIRVPIGLAGNVKAVKGPEPVNLALRVANLGPNGFPFIKARDGTFLEVVPAKLSKAGRPLILNEAGKEVELRRVVRDANGGVRFFGVTGKPIATPRPQLAPRAQLELGVRDLVRAPKPAFVFRIDPSLISGPAKFKKPIFILPSGSVVDPEVGEADGNVQMTRAGSLIYYGIFVNDVYAYYLTGHKDGAIASNQFPTDASSLAAIQSFATAHSHTFLNPNALAIEIKTAWVDASTLADPGDYITMQAKVPTYNTSNPEHWTQSGTKTITAALVGMHVVGSTKGHPEMIWASFEHFGNSPNVAYAFVSSGAGNPTVTQPADSTGPTWLFCCSAAPAIPPVANASAGTANAIDSNFTGVPVRGTDTQRLAPWGAPNNQAPNPLVSIAGSNTEIISLNNDIRAHMDPADLRNQYMFIGATWTEGGQGATGNFHGSNGPTIAVGTNHLANTTMETFTQSNVFVNGSFPGPGCLSCHLTNTTPVSHVFNNTAKLF